jgi:ribosome-binding factor A
MERPKKSHRPEKMGALIQKELNVIIRNYLDTLAGIVTISKVELSKDLKWGKIWISIMGGDDQKILNELKANIYDIQGELNHVLASKVLPRISFHLDTSPRYAEHIDELIKKIHEEEE